MRKEGTASKAAHVTTGNVFDDLGLDPGEALEAKIKSDIWRAIINRIERAGYTQAELAGRLKVHQPDVSNLLNGKISRFSVTKLIQLAARLDLHAEVKMTNAGTARAKGKMSPQREKHVRRGAEAAIRA